MKPVRVLTLRHNTTVPRRSITTLYVGGLDAGISEDDIRDVFYAYGELASVRKVRREGRRTGLAVGGGRGEQCRGPRERIGCCKLGSWHDARIGGACRQVKHGGCCVGIENVLSGCGDMLCCVWGMRYWRTD